MNPQTITDNASRIIEQSQRALTEFGAGRISHNDFKKIADQYKQAKNLFQAVADKMQTSLDDALAESTIECKTNATQTNKDNENDRPINEPVPGIT